MRGSSLHQYWPRIPHRRGGSQMSTVCVCGGGGGGGGGGRGEGSQVACVCVCVRACACTEKLTLLACCYTKSLH